MMTREGTHLMDLSQAPLELDRDLAVLLEAHLLRTLAPHLPGGALDRRHARLTCILRIKPCILTSFVLVAWSSIS